MGAEINGISSSIRTHKTQLHTLFLHIVFFFEIHFSTSLMDLHFYSIKYLRLVQNSLPLCFLDWAKKNDSCHTKLVPAGSNLQFANLAD